MRTCRTAGETALLLHVMLTHSGLRRARVSYKTVQFLSGRKRIAPSFELQVREDLAEWGWSMIALNTGGYGVIAIHTIEAAKPVTPSMAFTPQELRDLHEGTFNWGVWLQGKPESESNPTLTALFT